MLKLIAESKYVIRTAYRNSGKTLAFLPCHDQAVDISTGFLLGTFLGFAFGVGCALAVMYSIFLGGYRAALQDSDLASAPERLLKARAKLGRAKMP